MRKFVFFSLLLSVCFIGCDKIGNNSQQSANDQLRSGAQFSEEEIEEIKDNNNPLRQGVSNYYNKEFGYSVNYPKSFKDLREIGNGMICHSKDMVATLSVTAEKNSSDIEEAFASTLAEYNKRGAEIEYSYISDDKYYEIKGTEGGHHFYLKALVYDGKEAKFVYEYDTAERKDMDPNAIYLWVGDELAESFIVGKPVVEQPKVQDKNSVASVAYVGEFWTFSTMRNNENFKKYPEFKDVNSWEAATDGKEVYLILPTKDDTKVTAKNTKTGERLYSQDNRPLIVRCNKNGESDIEITFIESSGKLVKFSPTHNKDNKPILVDGLVDMTR